MAKEVYDLLDGYAALMVASTLSVTGLRIVTGLPVVLATCCATARACVPGTRASPSSLVMETTSVLLSKFIFSSLSNGTGAALLAQTEAIDAGTPPHKDKRRRYRPLEGRTARRSAGLQDTPGQAAPAHRRPRAAICRAIIAAASAA